MEFHFFKIIFEGSDTPVCRCKLKQEKAPGSFLGGNISMDQVLTEKNRMKMNESWPNE